MDSSPLTLQLPPDVIESVVDHVSHLPTLHTLLTVHSTTLYAAAKRIYCDPFKTLLKCNDQQIGRREHRVFQLCRLLLRISPYRNDTIQTILEVSNFRGKEDFGLYSSLYSSSSTSPATSYDITTRVLDIDYISMIRSFVIHHIELLDIDHLYFRPRYRLGSIMGKPFHQGQLYLNARSSIIWSIAGHRLQYLRELEIPVCDLDRYQDHLQHLISLNNIIFDTDCPKYMVKTEMFDAIFGFLRRLIQLQEARGLQAFWDQRQRSSLSTTTATSNDIIRKRAAHKLDVFFHHPEKHGRIVDAELALRSKLFTILPPLYRPKVLKQANWLRFLTKAEEVELDGVRHISIHPNRVGSSFFYYWILTEPEKSPSWSDLQDRWPNTFSPNPLAKVLQKCRSLLSLVSFVDNHDIFQWAIDEKKSTFELPSQPSIPPPNPALKRAPLARLELKCTEDVGFQIINDAMEAFGETLVLATFDWGQKEIRSDLLRLPSSILGHSICGSPWSLLSLEKLSINSRTCIRMHSNTLNACPRLQTLHLLDELKELPHEMEYMQPPWSSLTNLRDLHLDGYAAITFHPETLRSMHQLEKLKLAAPCLKQIITAPPDDPSFNSQRWSWDWFLPRLKDLELLALFALRFKFSRALQYMPMLKSLCLNHEYFKRKLMDNDDSNDDNRSDMIQKEECIYQLGHLKRLILTGEWIISDTDLERLLNDLAPNLAQISLQCCKGYTTEKLLELTTKHQAHLKHCISSRVLTRSVQRKLGLEIRPENPTHRMRHAAWQYVDYPPILRSLEKEKEEVDHMEKARAKAEQARLCFWEGQDQDDNDLESGDQAPGLSNCYNENPADFCVYEFGSHYFRLVQ